MKVLLSALYNLCKSMSPVTRAALGAGTVFLSLNSYFNELWSALFSKIDAIVVPPMGGNPGVQALGFVNYCFPLDTLCTYLAAYMTLRSAMVAIRIIKSFVPSIA